MSIKAINDFFKNEAAGGILIGIAAIMALILNNSPLSNLYDGFLRIPVAIQIAEFSINKPLLLWINDGLMAVFFLLVGLEIKRQVLEGHLSTKSQMSLPALAAVGGLVFPAIIYSYINWGDANAMRGWAIPAATDIAFAIGVLSLLGSRIPSTLKVCLVAIAILDDLAAIVIIAIFYTDNISLFSLAVGAIASFILVVLNRRGVTDLSPYIVTGVILWACVLKSGVHATLAGVLLAFCIPLKAKNKFGKSPAISLEKGLHSWVAYLILPLFAFANAGVSLKGISIELLMQPVTLGITMGLFFGKQIGVMFFTLLGCCFNLCKLPSGVNWKQYYGMSLVTGIGFTMSLFIGTLAFEDLKNQGAVRLGVLLGSILSGSLGYLMLFFGAKKTK